MMTCKQCGKSFRGRTDKQYCSISCKNAFHKKTCQAKNARFKAVDAILHKNHTILDNLPWGNAKSIFLPKKELKKRGFCFQHCTRIFVNRKGRQFFVLYDIAWLEMENEMTWIIRDSK